MSLSDIFDEAFDLYKRNFALLAGIVAIIHVPVHILWNAMYFGLHLDRVMSYSGSTPSELYAILGMLAVWVLMGMLYTFLAVVQNGALTLAVSDRYLGRPVSIRGAYRRTLPYLLRLVLTWLFVFVAMGLALGVVLIIGVIGLAIVVAALEGAGVGSGAMATPAGAALLVLASVAELIVFIYVGAFVTQVVVIEGRAYSAAISRNWWLLRGRVLRVLGAAFVLVVIMLGILLALSESLDTVATYVVYPVLNASVLVQSIVSDAWLGAIWMFLQPYWMVCLTLLYYDQRVRREAFDLSLLERNLGGAVQGGQP